MTRFVVALTALWGLFFGMANVAHAEFKVEISGVGITQISIGISEFKGADVAPQKITQIVAADLDRSGQFKSSNAGITLDENSRPDFVSVKSKNIDGLLTGSVTRF